MNQLPKVSVCMITYGHEQFIEEAIKGVLMQEVEFGIELIIANDCSPDKTHEIIRNIISRHPKKNLIKYYKHDENVGMKPNCIFALKHCTGKYIAMCDGDDYWTDPYKLQKQVDFLEANETCALSFHQTKTIYDDGREHLYNNFELNSSFNFVDLVRRPFISTVSSVFRNPNPLPDWFEEIASDWPLFLHISSKGNLYYMSECMAVYRRHSQGVWSSLSNDVQYNNTILLLDKLDRIFGYKYHEDFEKSKQARYQIHYPVMPVLKKISLPGRLKRKLKSIFLPGN